MKVKKRSKYSVTKKPVIKCDKENVDKLFISTDTVFK